MLHHGHTSGAATPPSKAAAESFIHSYIRKDFTTNLITVTARACKSKLSSFEECEAAISEASQKSNWIEVAAIGLYISISWPHRLRGPLAHHDGLKNLNLLADARKVLDTAICDMGPGALLIQRLIVLHIQCCRPDEALSVFNENSEAATDPVSLKAATDAALKLKDFTTALAITDLPGFPLREVSDFQSRIGREKAAWDRLSAEWDRLSISQSALTCIESCLVEKNTDLALAGIWTLYISGRRDESFFDVATQIFPTESERSERVVFFRSIAYLAFPSKLSYVTLYVRATFFSYQYEHALDALVDNSLVIDSSSYLKLRTRLEDLMGGESSFLARTQTPREITSGQYELEAMRSVNMLKWLGEDVRSAHFALPLLKRTNSPAVPDVLRLPAPVVRREKNNFPRVAVCISGQLRSAHTNLPHIFSNIVEPLRADVFIHTWDKAQCTLPRFRHIHRFIGSELTNCLPAHLRETPAFSARFPATSRKLVAPVETVVTPAWLERIIEFKKCVIETEKDFFDRNVSQSLKFARTFNQAKMFYKLRACDNLRRSHELEVGTGYDAVIRIRPDLQIKVPEIKNYVINAIENKNRVFVHYVDVMGAGDQFAIASPEAMQAYTSIWEFLEKYNRWDYLPGFDNEPAEILVGNHLLAAGLQAQLIPASHNNLATDLAISHHDITEELESDAINHGDPSEVEGFLLSYKKWHRENFISSVRVE